MDISSLGMPDIAYLSTAMATSEVSSKVGVAVLANNLDTMEAMGNGMQKMMELSVNPGIGAKFDMSV